MERRSLRQLSSPTLADQAYEALREAIISGELAPLEKITERGLAARLSVSPTPVREALRRLEQDQLVFRAGPRTVHVASLDDDRAAELRHTEGTLRALAARFAADNATPAQLAGMERLLDDGDAELRRLQDVAGTRPVTLDDLTDLLTITRAFHEAMNEAANNPVLLRLLGLVDAFSLAHRRRRVQGELRQGQGEATAERYREHRAVLDAVRAGDGIEAERLMLAHAAADAIGALH